MKIIKNILPLFLFLAFVATACNQGTDVVESGTYTGKVVEVEPSKSEIYVQTDEGKLELYFTEETKLTMDGQKVAFAELDKGDQVEVKVEKVGKRLDPLTVKIMP